MYKMANFPITFGDFFLCVDAAVVVCPPDYGAITEKCEKKCIFKAIIIAERKSFVKLVHRNEKFFQHTNVLTNMQTLYNLIFLKLHTLVYFYVFIFCYGLLFFFLLSSVWL